MIPTTLKKALAALEKARCPEDIFGTDIVTYRDWVKICHEDKVPAGQKDIAHKAFLLLTKWHEDAESKIKRGTYGDNKPSITAVLKTKTASYNLLDLIAEQAIASIYEAETDKGIPCLVKICRSPKNNDLMKVEADLLAKIPAILDPKHTVYFPNLLDSFEIQQGKVKVRANVFAKIKDAIPLSKVRKAYPKGLDPKDASWMWNRMLEAIHLFHSQGYVHANLTPDSFLIVPETHQGMLIDFCYAVKVGSKAKAIVPEWKGIYPLELLDKKSLDFGADLSMVSHVMNYLLGANPPSTKIPAGVPVAIAGLLRSCWLGKAHRTNSAKELYSDFKTVRKGLGWKKEFRPFILNPT